MGGPTINFGSIQLDVSTLATGVINVGMPPYNAKGDGVTDDTAAIQAAIDAAFAKGGGAVFFPFPAKYKVTAQIVVKPFVLLKGADMINLQDQSTVPIFLVYTGKNDPNGPAAFKLKRSSGMSGLSFFYPEQVDTNAAAPTPFSWLIDTTKAVGDPNTDNVFLENLMLINPYQGINLQDAGRFNLANIYGDPIYKGIRVDGVLDVARGRHIHFWTFTYLENTPMRTWMRNNGIAFDLYRVDQLSAFDWFAFGYKVGLNLNAGVWADFSSCLLDVVVIPILVNGCNQVHFTGGSLISTGNTLNVCVQTGADIQGQLLFDNTTFRNAGVGALILSNSGKVALSGCDFKASSMSDGLQLAAFVVGGTCEVAVNGCTGVHGQQYTGRDNVLVDGVRMQPITTDITPANFAFGTWAGNSPTGWTGNNTAADVAAIAGGVALKLVPGAAGANAVRFMDFAYPTLLLDEKDVYVLALKLKTTNATAGTFRFYLNENRADGLYPTMQFAVPSGYLGPDLQLYIPLYIGEVTGARTIRIEWHAFGTVSGQLEVTGLTWYRAARTAGTIPRLELLPDWAFKDPFGNGLVTSFRGGQKTIMGYAAPTSGTWSVGDKVINKTPAAAGYEGWVCTAAGTPGTWKTYGAISP